MIITSHVKEDKIIMTYACPNKFSQYFILGISFLYPNITYSTSNLNFDGALGDVLCINQGNILIKDNARVKIGEIVECHTSGGNIRITGLVAQLGSRFNAVAHPRDILMQAIYPPEMPETPMPELKGCSNNQEDFLRNSWRRAHFFVWHANEVVSSIQSASEDVRSKLWVQSDTRKWFGFYDTDRAEYVDKALDKALARFEMRGKVVKKIRTIRCGSPIAPKADEHTDVCPAGNPGGKGSPSAYHAPVGVIVTCPSFWDYANDETDYENRLSAAAITLVHETFHWLSVNGLYIVDYHGDGVGGLKDDKYYGRDNASHLAENKPSWAIRNNDNYAIFAHDVGLAAIKIKIGR